ncbi:HEAT repeat domain-containing protein [Alloacidobacterium sp.]|uniref:HEAT repeat domain-containing protein n=1 Tax=Alloacidobacterium sp. TaxID=2951999 RepID=UPI002D339618|nr:HEAT repeat domain-containing protein [Alloacidobacterium sp.]HYK35127.1 HEAT repeat domain-containing protein [Alloacidobacterium sp.]
MRHVFISYCHEDADFVHVLEDQLKQASFAVWKDRELRAGDDWHAEIESAIRLASAVILVLSETALTSEYVNFEWAFAAGAGVPILPLLLKIKADRLHPRLRALQFLDFSNYMLRPWDELTRSLKVLANVERQLTMAVPRDAPRFIQKAAQELDSPNADERIAAIEMLAENHDPSVLEILAEASKHPAPDVRDRAAEALAEVQDLRALPAIMDAIRYKRWDRLNVSTLAKLGDAAVPNLVTMLRDPAQGVHVRRCIAMALEDLRNNEAVNALHELLKSPEGELRIQAVKSLAGEPRALPWILEALQDKDTDWAAIKALQKYRGPEVVAALVEGLKNPELSIRQAAVGVLKEVPDANAIPALMEALRDEDNVVSWDACAAIEKVIDSSTIPALFQVLEQIPNTYTGGNINTRDKIIDLLVGFKGEIVLNGLLALLKHPDVSFRGRAAYALGELGDQAALLALHLALKDPDERVRSRVARAIGMLKDASAVPDLIAISQNEGEFHGVREAAANALASIGTREARIAHKDWQRYDKER